MLERKLLMSYKNTDLLCIHIKITDAIWKFNDAFLKGRY